MPGEQPQGAPPPARTGDPQPCQVASGLGCPCQPPCEGHTPASGPTKATRETGHGAQAVEPPEAQPRPAREGVPKAPLLRTKALGSGPGKGGGLRAPPGRSRSQGRVRPAGGTASSTQQPYGLSIASSRAKPALDNAPEGRQLEAAQPPEAEDPRTPLRPGLPRAEARPPPEELSFQRCFPETPSSFTSTNYTSANATPGPPALRAPPSRGASPLRPASHLEFQASGADSWPPAAENSFPGANFGVPPAEPEPLPKVSRPGGPTGVPFQFSFPALHGPGTKPFRADTARHEYANGALVFAFHQPPGAWTEEAVGTGPAYPPAPPPLPCYPGQPGTLDPPSNLSSALSAPGVAHPAPTPFSDGLHKSLTKALPDRPPSAQDGLGSPRGALNSLPQRRFPGQACGARVDASPGPLDTELATPGPPPARLPPLWDPAAAPYPAPALGPLAPPRSSFFKGQPGPGQRLCLPRSPPLPWAQMLPTAGPSPHQMEVPSRLPFPTAVPEWQGGSQGALGTASQTAGPGEKLVAMRSGPGQLGGSPGLFPYSGPQDPGAQPLFFGVAQPQLSPRGTPSLPPPRVVGASPSESPLPSPATNTAGSTCSSLSPLSSSPANPSSEESQLQGPLGPPSFFHQSPEPPHAHPTHFQAEPAKAFAFPADGLGAEGAVQCLEEAPFPHEPPPYPTQHFSLSSASLDQLDVLLTCRQCDRNYSSLAAFLAHRQFCSLLLARAKDGHQQPQGPPGLPSPSAAPRAAAADAHAGGLNHGKAVPFPLAGDVQADGKDDALRMSVLPGLATAAFPLPATDLDMEDDAKLDSLITEALNGMEYQSDSPEIDSSFIDVFTDEEPSGPRGPGTGQPPKARVGPAPESKAQPPLVAATTEPQGPRPVDGGCPTRSGPKTRSLGLAPAEADGSSLGRQQRRGKQLKLFRKELDVANTTKGPSGGARAACLRPRRKGSRAERPRPRARDLRTQAPKGRADPDTQGPRAAPVPEETGSPRHLRQPPRKDPKRKKAGAGTWSKELIHKIVQQKNKLHRRQARRVRGRRGSLVAEGPPPGAEDGGLRECEDASESEDELPRQRGRPPRGRRWHRGEKRKDADLAWGPRADRQLQGPSQALRQRTGELGGLPSPEQPCSPHPGPPPSPEAAERGPTCANHPTAAPQHAPQVPTDTETPEENQPLLDVPQEAKRPEVAEKSPPDPVKPREVSSPPPATYVKGSPSPPAPERAPPGREDAGSPKHSGSSPAPGPGSLLGAPGCMRPPASRDREDSAAHQPGGFLGPVANVTDTAYPEPTILFSKNSDLAGPAHAKGHPTGVPIAKKGPHPYSGTPSELFLGPKDLAGCFPEVLYSKPPAADTPPARGPCLCRDGEDACFLEPKPPEHRPYADETDPAKARSPLTLESTSLFPGLAVDGFGPPLYDSLSAHRDTHAPLAHAGPALAKPPVDPPYPSFLLLEEVAPMLPSHFPDLSAGRAFGEKRPGEGALVPSPPPAPGKGSERSSAFVRSLSEEELEIQRLVTELESQLRRSGGSPGAPGERGEAERASGADRSARTEPSAPHRNAADLAGAGASSPRQEAAETAVATTEGALGISPEQGPRPATRHPGEAAASSGTQEDLASGAPLCPPRASCSFQLVQKATVSEAEGEGRVPSDVCLPDPGGQLEPLLDAERLAECSPNRALSFPQNKDIAGTRERADARLLRPCAQGGGLFPESQEVAGPCGEHPALGSLGGPAAHPAPGLAFQDDRALPLDATGPPGARHSEAAQGPSVGRTGGAGGLLHPMAGGPGSKGIEFAPAGASSLTAPPGREAQAGPGERPQDPTLSPQLQLLGAEAAGSKDNTQGSQGPPPVDAQSPQRGDPSALEGHRVKGKDVACSPAQSSFGGEQGTAVPAAAGRQPGPKADRHLGLLGPSEEPEGQGQASRLQPDNWGLPGGSDSPAPGTGPETALAGPVGGAGAACEGRRVALGPQNEAQPSPSPPSPAGEPPVPAPTAAHTQSGAEDQTPEKATGPGLDKQLPLARPSPASPLGGLAACAPSPIAPATPSVCSLKHLPQQDPPTWTSGATRARGEQRGLLPASPPSKEPPSPGLLPACPPAWAPLGGAGCVQPLTDAAAGGPPGAAPSLTTRPCDPKETLAHHPLLGDSSPLGDPPSQPGFVSISGDSMLRLPEEPRKERPADSPASDTPPPPVGATSPKVTSHPARDETGAARGLQAPEPPCGGAPPTTSPAGLPKGPSPPSPSSAAQLGCREAQGVVAVPTDPTMLGTTGPDGHTCLEGELGTSSQGQPEPGAPEAGHCSVTEVPTVACPPAGLGLGRTTSPNSTARDFRPHSPQSHRNVLFQAPQEDPLSPQDVEQRPHGFKKKPVSTENGLWKGQATSGPPVTCELCAASFRSRPGLSRHKARKHQPRKGTAQPSPATPTCRPPGKKSHRAPRKDRQRHCLTGPCRTAGPPPAQGSKEVRQGLGAPRTPRPHPPGLLERGARARSPASEPSRPDPLGPGELHPKQAEKREDQVQPPGAPSNSAGKSKKKGGKPGARRFRERARGPADVISDKPRSSPDRPAPPSCRLPREGDLAPSETEGTAETGAGALCAEGTPRDQATRRRRTEEAPAGEWPAGRDGAWARGPWGPRQASTVAEPPQAARSKSAEGSGGAESRPEEGVWEGHAPPLGPPGPPETPSSDGGLLDEPGARGAVQGPEGPTAEAPSPGLGDPLSLFDDEVSFSQLFPLGGRFTRKKRNPRVYGKRCEKPRRPPPPPEPSSEAGSSSPLPCARLPTDLSDSGSLCLSHEEPWEDEVAGLPEPFLPDGFLGSKVSGADRWAPGLSLWAPEPSGEAGTEKAAACHPEDDRPETIPELHMVPAAWRGRELWVPADDTPSSLGDASPEPPNLERERFDSGFPGNADLLPLPPVDFEALSPKVEVQDLCFLGPFEDPVDLPGTSCLNFKATAKPQGPRNERTEAAAGPRGAQGREPPAQGKRAAYKCRACFQRFRRLAELDLHKLAHSPSPHPTCYMCVERRFGSRELLREHLQDKHLQGKAGPWACGMCLKEVADVWMYNQHLREHAVQFARRGQVRRSLGDLPGCLEGGSPIARLLSSVTEPASKPHRGRRSGGKAHGSPREPSGPARGAGKESPRERAKPRARAAASGRDGASTPDAWATPAAAGSSAALPGPSKTAPSPSPDPWSGSEPLLQAIPVHADCKDPSRDCHHCGKRFPKPFKLQRHLAVHSPQRVYLCPRCPRVYPEHRQLLAHLGAAHGAKEQQELQHTPLYACELCADVMHITKKSFACSSCNYTFAKKEQFDRHMDKHLRRGQQPFTFRGVRRPGAPGQKAPALEGTLPSKRRRVAVPSSPPGPSVDGPLSRGSSPALLQVGPEAAPSTTEGPPKTLERPEDPAGPTAGRCDLPPDLQEDPPPALSPFPTASADSRGDLKPDRALERPEDEASPGSPGPLVQPALLSGGALPQPGARGQATEGKGAPLTPSGKRRTPGPRAKCGPEHSQEDPSLFQKEKQVSTCRMVPEGDTGVPSHKGNATRPGACRSSSKDRSAASTPSPAPKLPVQPRKASGSLAPGELVRGTENGTKATTPKDRPGPSSQGSGGPRPGTKTGGGSQPQPASGQLQSETATTPARPGCPGQSPAPDKTPPQAQAKGCTKGPRGAGDQGPRPSPGPREKGGGGEKRRKGQVPGLTGSENAGSLGRAPPAPDRPPRAPRKQATPSRVPPAKPRPSSQNSKPRPQPSEPGHAHRKEAQGRAFPQARPLLRPPRRGRAVHGAEPADRGYRTAEAQSDLLSQLFGQRLTGFKIPLKKDTSE
uniref:Zinc finger protein 469 n=1 Tax=Propithecus coquereli TaxID=379532 RepID=A0A2K6FY46_PROCO